MQGLGEVALPPIFGKTDFLRFYLVCQNVAVDIFLFDLKNDKRYTVLILK